MEHSNDALNLWLILQEIGNWFIWGVVIKYVFAKWLAQSLVNVAKRFLVSTKQHAIYWLHYRERAIGHGHDYETPEECTEGICRSIHATA